MLLRNVLFKTLRDHRRALMWWSIGIVLLNGFMIAFYPSIQDMEDDLLTLVEAYPEDLMALLGISDLTEITSPAGYLNAELFGFMLPIIFIAFAVGLGTGAIAGEEGNGTLDMLMSEPITRGRLILDKFAAIVIEMAILGLVLWASLAIGSVVVGMDISILRLAEMTVSSTLLGLTVGTLGFASGCVTGSRGLSIGVAAAAAVGTWLFNALSVIVDVMEPAKWVSPFYYYSGANPLTNGLNSAHAAALLGTIAVLAVVGYFGFQRRDLKLG